MRKPVLAANWKMYKSKEETAAFITAFIPLVEGVADREIIICPSFTNLAVLERFVPDNINIGAQNMHWEEQGAFTGEISPAMVKEAGCRYVILGHSERRQYFGETNQIINKKIRAAFEAHLIPIFCVGETLDEREAGQTERVIDCQVREGIASLAAGQVREMVIAYEPVWAIGTGRSATARDANQVISYIRSIVAEMHGEGIAAAVRILYGGSVKPETAAELMAQSDIDGALVGGASLDAASFARIVKY